MKFSFAVAIATVLASTSSLVEAKHKHHHAETKEHKHHVRTGTTKEKVEGVKGKVARRGGRRLDLNRARYGPDHDFKAKEKARKDRKLKKKVPLKDYIKIWNNEPLNGCFSVNVGEGEMCCYVGYWPDESYDSLSQKGFKEGLGFPPGSECHFDGDLSCEDLVEAEFEDGPFKGELVFPHGLPSGFKIHDEYDDADGYHVAHPYSFTNGYQWEKDTEMTGGAEEMPNRVVDLSLTGKYWYSYNLKEKKQSIAHVILRANGGVVVDIPDFYEPYSPNGDSCAETGHSTGEIKRYHADGDGTFFEPEVLQFCFSNQVESGASSEEECVQEDWPGQHTKCVPVSSFPHPYEVQKDSSYYQNYQWHQLASYEEEFPEASVYDEIVIANDDIYHVQPDCSLMMFTPQPPMPTTYVKCVPNGNFDILNAFDMETVDPPMHITWSFHYLELHMIEHHNMIDPETGGPTYPWVLPEDQIEYGGRTYMVNSDCKLYDTTPCYHYEHNTCVPNGNDPPNSFDMVPTCEYAPTYMHWSFMDISALMVGEQTLSVYDTVDISGIHYHLDNQCHMGELLGYENPVPPTPEYQHTACVYNGGLPPYAYDMIHTAPVMPAYNMYDCTMYSHGPMVQGTYGRRLDSLEMTTQNINPFPNEIFVGNQIAWDGEMYKVTDSCYLEPWMDIDPYPFTGMPYTGAPTEQKNPLDPSADDVAAVKINSFSHCYDINIGEGVMCCNSYVWPGTTYTTYHQPSSTLACTISGDYTCEDISKLEIVAGNHTSMQDPMHNSLGLVFPNAEPKGLKLDYKALMEGDFPMPYSKEPWEFTFKMVDGEQFGMEGRLTGEAEESSRTMTFTHPGPHKLSYTSRYFHLGAAIGKFGSRSNVIMPADGKKASWGEISDPSGENYWWEGYEGMEKLSSVEFCFTKLPAMPKDALLEPDEGKSRLCRPVAYDTDGYTPLLGFKAFETIYLDADEMEEHFPMDPSKYALASEKNNWNHLQYMLPGEVLTLTEEMGAEEWRVGYQMTIDSNCENFRYLESNMPTPGPTPAPEPSPKSPTPAVTGDPHFVMWSGRKYDFHGGCDLVLLKDPSFSKGKGLSIHIRTKILRWWSYVETAVVQIGKDTLEVRGVGGRQHVYYFVNGRPGPKLGKASMMPFTIGGYPVGHSVLGDHEFQFKIFLKNDQNIVVKAIKDFMRVEVENPTVESFGKSVGLMGSFEGGEMLGRDGHTVFSDPVTFGKEWQVHQTEPMLFHNVEGVQHPNACTMPEDVIKASGRRRRLEGSMSREQAEIACSQVSPDQLEDCIFDVLATNDVEMAAAF